MLLSLLELFIIEHIILGEGMVERAAKGPFDYAQRVFVEWGREDDLIRAFNEHACTAIGLEIVVGLDYLLKKILFV